MRWWGGRVALPVRAQMMSLTGTQTSPPEASWGSQDWGPLDAPMSCDCCNTVQNKSMHALSDYMPAPEPSCNVIRNICRW